MRKNTVSHSRVQTRPSKWRRYRCRKTSIGQCFRSNITRSMLCLYSPVSRLLNVVDFLAYFWGIGGEIDEGMRKWSGSKLRRVGLGGFLADFWFSPSAAPHAMVKGRAQGKNKHVRMVLNINSAASASADGLQKCWFKGFDVGAGGYGRH